MSFIGNKGRTHRIKYDTLSLLAINQEKTSFTDSNILGIKCNLITLSAILPKHLHRFRSESQRDVYSINDKEWADLFTGFGNT